MRYRARIEETGGSRVLPLLPSWFELRAGNGCPLCAPRPVNNELVYFVCQLAVSSLYLARNQTYRGTCAIVYDPAHVTRPSELDRAAWQRFCADGWRVEQAVSQAFAPDHVNLECLGNTVPHLHMHIVPRYRSDPRWGQPIWTTSRDAIPFTTTGDAECEELAELIRCHLDHAY
jgi:diadenosine tetraphosphate (Ap4A) HIT family hydrolase